jgi:cell division protein FtsB
MINHTQIYFDRRSEQVAAPRRLAQAYRQAPWRIQTQRGMMLLIVAILGASVLWVMVSVSVQAAAAGLEIQMLEEEQEKLRREIAALKTEFAILTSAAQMEQRASSLGFRLVTPDEISFVIVPGYTGREPVIQAPPPGTSIQPPLVVPAYTQSLWEWMLQGFLQLSEQPGGVSP